MGSDSDDGARRAAASANGTSDRYHLYQRAVQEPEAEIEFITETCSARFGRRPLRLREDFCGTGFLATEWVRSDPQRQAWAVDVDPDPLDWGRKNNAATLSAEQRRRLRLLEGDVRRVRTPPVDALTAFNFSYFVFDKRDELLGYFRAARAALGERGLLFLDVYGGPDAQRELEETTEHEGFDYVWQQTGCDAIRQRVSSAIHFDLPGGERIEEAFTYDWRLWSIPELREILADAGFGTTEVHWEGTDEATGEGDGVFTRAESAENTDSWIAYLVAVP